MKKKIPLRDRGPGLDKSDWSLRDVFNDVSKYIRLISISLNRVFPNYWMPLTVELAERGEGQRVTEKDQDV